MQIIQSETNGFSAESIEEWESQLRELLSNQELRMRIGSAARATIEEKWSVAAWGEKYLKLITGEE